MNCEDALVLLSGHLDGQNTVEEEAQLQAHLAECSACRRLLEDLQAFDQELISLEVEPPADLCQNVMDAIRKEAPIQKRKRRWLWPTISAAAVVVLLLGAGALAAPKPPVAEDIAVPQMARMSLEDAEPETETASVEPEASLSNETAGVSLYRGTDEPSLFAAAAPEDCYAQTLAEERSAPVVLLYTPLSELEGLPCEALEDGSLLYTLEAASDAEALWNAYQNEAVLYLPAAETSDVSYALLLP